MIERKLILKKDIVIPAGTEFSRPPNSRSGEHNVETVIGITKDTSGYVNYYADPNDEEISDWFQEV